MPVYNGGFMPNNLRQAQDMAVGDINGLSMALRWDVETKVFSELIVGKAAELGINTVLDYGCGPGRMINGICSISDLKIVAVDQSENMLTQAKAYNKEFAAQCQFYTVSEFDALPESEKKFELAYCIYVIQHTPDWDVRPTILRLHGATKRVIFVNSTYRMALPKFSDDGNDDMNEMWNYFPNVDNFIPGEILFSSMVMRTMFLTGGIRHYAFLMERE